MSHDMRAHNGDRRLAVAMRSDGTKTALAAMTEGKECAHCGIKFSSENVFERHPLKGYADDIVCRVCWPIYTRACAEVEC